MKFRDCFLSNKCKSGYNDYIVNNFIDNNKIYASFLDCLFNIDADFFKSDNYHLTKTSSGKDKRISHPVFFNLYFNRIIGADVNEFILAKDLFHKMTCQNQFIQALSNIELNSLENVVRNLIEYESDFTEEHALNSIPVLYQYLPLVPYKERGMFDFGVNIVWSRLTYRLLQSIPKENIYDIILQLLNNCYVYLGNAVDSSVLASEDILYSLLKSSIAESKTQKGSDPTIYREEHLRWEWLIMIYGDEEKLNCLVDSISSNKKYKNAPVISLAIKYRNGWKPTED